MHKSKQITPGSKTPPPARARRVGASVPPVQAHGHKARTGRQSSAPPKRRRNRKPIHWTPIIVRTAVFAAIVTLVTLALTSPRLVIRHLEVVGTRTVSPQEVGILAAVPGRQNIFRYYLAQHHALPNRVTHGEPAIESASVGLHLPGTLVVHVVEREPYALLQASDGSGWLLDPNAVPYRQVPSVAAAAAQSGLPRIATESAPGQVRLGKPLAPEMKAPVISAYALLDALRQTPCPSLETPRRIDVDRYANVSLILTNGLKIKLGQPEGLADKLGQVQATLDTDRSLAERAQYLDFTSPRPAWMPRPPALPAKTAALTQGETP